MGVSYDDLVLPDRVHSRVYTDAAVFDDEIERIYHRGWAYLGHESEIPEPGDYRTRDVGRQPLLFVRGADREVRALMNRCSHRGAVVCPYERGNAGFAAHRSIWPRSVGSPLGSTRAGTISRHAARFAKFAEQLTGIESPSPA